MAPRFAVSPKRIAITPTAPGESTPDVDDPGATIPASHFAAYARLAKVSLTSNSRTFQDSGWLGFLARTTSVHRSFELCEALSRLTLLGPGLYRAATECRHHKPWDTLSSVPLWEVRLRQLVQRIRPASVSRVCSRRRVPPRTGFSVSGAGFRFNSLQRRSDATSPQPDLLCAQNRRWNWGSHGSAHAGKHPASAA